MKYKVFKREVQIEEFERQIDCFEKEINDAIKDNWIPRGGISLIPTTNSIFIIAQAMTKEN